MCPSSIKTSLGFVWRVFSGRAAVSVASQGLLLSIRNGKNWMPPPFTCRLMFCVRAGAQARRRSSCKIHNDETRHGHLLATTTRRHPHGRYCLWPSFNIPTNKHTLFPDYEEENLFFLTRKFVDPVHVMVVVLVVVDGGWSRDNMLRWIISFKNILCNLKILLHLIATTTNYR